MFIDKYKARTTKKGLFNLLFLGILGSFVYLFTGTWIGFAAIFGIGLILFITMLYSNHAAQKDIGKVIELTNADYPDGVVLFSGKIIDIMYYKPYKRVCTIVDTQGYTNTYSSEDRGNRIVLLNRYVGDGITGKRVVNTYVIKNDMNISDEKECLEYSDFKVFCDLKYKK